MKIRIHRGTEEIGGTCIEVESNGGRIVLDLGLPLNAPDGNHLSLLPSVSGFRNVDDSLLGVLLSHPHLDHYGLAQQIRPDVPVYIGRDAHNILTPPPAATSRAGTPSPTPNSCATAHRSTLALSRSRLIWRTTAPSTPIPCWSRLTTSGSSTPATSAPTDVKQSCSNGWLDAHPAISTCCSWRAPPSDGQAPIKDFPPRATWRLSSLKHSRKRKASTSSGRQSRTSTAS